ncbi:MAG TPA: hypothetical protein VEK11_03860 [Thermoanaerobaculia bacterium]|nr:hypothetical protein [Thermoanaerobaculia bacterium]
MIESNRRRVLAGACASVLSAMLLLHVVRMFADDGSAPSQAAIALSGFTAVLHVGFIVAAAFGVTQLVRHRADRLGLAGAALTCLGAVVGARIGVFIQLSQLQDSTPGAVRGAISALLHNAKPVWASIIPIGLMYPLGLMLLGIALIVARPVNRWIGVVLLIGGFFFPVGRALGIPPAFYISDAMTGIAWGILGWTMLTKREVWHGGAVPQS